MTRARRAVCRLLERVKGSLPEDAPKSIRMELVLDRAILADLSGDAEEAKTCYDQVLRRARKAADPEIIGQAMVGLAELERFDGNLDAAETLYQDALEIQKPLGHQRFEAITRVNLAIVALARGDLDGADRNLDLVAELGADVAHPEVAVVYSFCRALVASRRDDLGAARRELYRYQAVNSRVHLHEPDIAEALEELGLKFREAGEQDYGDGLLEQSIAMWNDLDLPMRATETKEKAGWA